tara:strand:+ start:90070 stop:91554 length:1485 start_codon:yes stop_codon:yes gene_type:complete
MNISNRFSANLIAVLGSGLAPFAITLITLPLLIEIIGLERYGLLSIAWMVTSSVGFLQMGMGRAVVQRLNAARRVGSIGSLDDRNSILISAFSLTLAASVAASVIASIAIYTYCVSFEVVASDLMLEVLKGLVFLSASVFLGFWVSLLLGVYQADERFYFYSTIRFFNVAGAQLLPLAAAFAFKPEFDILMMAVMTSRMAIVIAMLYGIRSDLRQMTKSKLTRARSLDLLSFGGWVSVLGLLSPMLVILDRFLIGAAFGAGAVGIYTVAYNLCTRLLVIPTSVSNVMLPKLSRLTGELLNLHSSRGLQVTAMLMTPTVVGFVVVYEPFVTVWMNFEIAAQTSRIAAILAIGVWITSIAQGPYTRLTSENRVRTIAIWHMMQVPVYAVALWLSLKALGPIGAAYCWSARTVADTIGLMIISRMRLVWTDLLLFGLVVMTTCSQILIPEASQRLIVGTVLIASSLVTASAKFISLGGMQILRKRSSKVQESKADLE